MITQVDVPTAILVSSIAGLISGYLAFRRGKNPILWFLIGLVFGVFGVFAFLFATNPRKKGALTPKPVKPEPYLHGPANKFWYYLDPTNTQIGPMSYNGITEAWKKGSVVPTTYVWHEELAEWKPFQELIRTEESL